MVQLYFRVLFLVKDFNNQANVKLSHEQGLGLGGPFKARARETSVKDMARDGSKVRLMTFSTCIWEWAPPRIHLSCSLKIFFLTYTT